MHARIRSLALESLDRALTAAEQTELQAHLAECADCREAVQALRLADGALRQWAALDARMPPATQALPPARSAHRSGWPLAVAATLGLLVGAAGGLFAPAALRLGGRPTPEPSIAGAPPPVGPVATPAPPAGSTPADTAGRQVYVLLLEEQPERWPPPAPLRRQGYGDWSRTLRTAGQGAGGRQLVEDEGWYLRQDGVAVPAHARPGGAVNYSGWFLVRARSYEEAIELARIGPHLTYGGILIRRAYGN